MVETRMVTPTAEFHMERIHMIMDTPMTVMDIHMMVIVMGTRTTKRIMDIRMAVTRFLRAYFYTFLPIHLVILK